MARKSYISRPKSVEFDIQAIQSDRGRGGLFCLSESTWELAYSMLLTYGGWRSRYYHTDPATGRQETITDDEWDAIQQIYQTALEELHMSNCIDLTSVAQAINNLAAAQCCDDGGAGAGRSEAPETATQDNGTDSPDIERWANYGQYNSAKCTASTLQVGRLQGNINRLQAINFAGIASLPIAEIAAILIPVLITPVPFDDIVFWAGVIALGSTSFTGPLQTMEDGYNASSDDIICALYNAPDARTARDNARAVWHAGIDGLSATEPGVTIAKLLANGFVNMDFANSVFDDATYKEEQSDCSSCYDKGCDVWYCLGDVYQELGVGSLVKDGGLRDITAVYDETEGYWYISAQVGRFLNQLNLYADNSLMDPSCIDTENEKFHFLWKSKTGTVTDTNGVGYTNSVRTAYGSLAENTTYDLSWFELIGEDPFTVELYLYTTGGP